MDTGRRRCLKGGVDVGEDGLAGKTKGGFGGRASAGKEKSWSNAPGVASSEAVNRLNGC